MAKEPPRRLGLVFEDYGLQVELKATALLILEVLLSRMPLKQIREKMKTKIIISDKLKGCKDKGWKLVSWIGRGDEKEIKKA
ncbi:hypothetical protein VNO77_23466 [Canavalia gladiata]|uniref:Uncharacterized protein n=1 Tax=Canavalia gladiata TaxID=3824 RepID=A0AAN9L5A1_CANGL